MKSRAVSLEKGNKITKFFYNYANHRKRIKIQYGKWSRMAIKSQIP
jgi:hypothetical protein